MFWIAPCCKGVGCGIIDDIALKKVKADFIDSGVRPRVGTKLNELNLYMQNITLAGIKPLQYQMNIRVNDAFKCISDGSIEHNILKIKSYSKCDGLDLVHYRPYIDKLAKKELKVYNVRLQKAKLSFDANVNLEDSNSQMLLAVSNANIKLNDFILSKRHTGERLLRFNDFDVNGVNLNTKDKNISINKVTFNKLKINTKRLKNNTLKS